MKIEPSNDKNTTRKITTLYSYIIELSFNNNLYELDLSNNINNEHMVMNLTKEELKSLVDFINEYLKLGEIL